MASKKKSTNSSADRPKCEEELEIFFWGRFLVSIYVEFMLIWKCANTYFHASSSFDVVSPLTFCTETCRCDAKCLYRLFDSQILPSCIIFVDYSCSFSKMWNRKTQLSHPPRELNFIYFLDTLSHMLFGKSRNMMWMKCETNSSPRWLSRVLKWVVEREKAWQLLIIVSRNIFIDFTSSVRR